MSKCLFLMVFTSFLLPLLAEQTQTPPSQEWLNDQHDQTDTLAIPLDSSEEEEKEEMDALQKERATHPPKVTKPVTPVQ